MAEEKKGFFSRLKERLVRTRDSLAQNVRRIFSGHTLINDEVFDELEETLIQADIGVDTTNTIIQDMRRICKERHIEDPSLLYDILKEELVKLIGAGDHEQSWQAPDGPHVTLVVGVNGSGKTTTAGKLALLLQRQGKSVLLGAADTFRAAAVEQLSIWSQRAGVDIIKHQEGSDPAAVAYDAADAAAARKVDCLLIDTAGRLHTKVNLMEELKKINRVVGKRLPGSPHAVLLVLDATTGQNGLQQARVFTEALNVTGLVVTKLDGTAKGGVALAIQRQLGVPIKYIGVGESAEDLQPFNALDFVNALFT